MIGALPEMHSVVSSHIAAIGYDAPSRALYVRFESGATWRYENVEATLHRDFVAADSIGKFFAQRIKPGHHGAPASDTFLGA